MASIRISWRSNSPKFPLAPYLHGRRALCFSTTICAAATACLAGGSKAESSATCRIWRAAVPARADDARAARGIDDADHRGADGRRDCRSHRSTDVFEEVQEMTAPLDRFCRFIHALDWLDLRNPRRRAMSQAFFDGRSATPCKLPWASSIHLAEIVASETDKSRSEAIRLGDTSPRRESCRRRTLPELASDFPGVWSDWESADSTGGFDAIIGNPPWDRMKLQQVEWFAARRREIALAQRAADRKRMIAALEKAGDPLAKTIPKRTSGAEAGCAHGAHSGDYPLLVRRRREHLFAVCRAGDEAREAGRHRRASDPIRYRLR